MASLDLDEELLKDKELITNIQNLDHSIVDIETLLESRISVDYTSLSTEDKIKHDLLIAFTLNSLYWMYLRLDGVDPTTHNIKRELDRVKTTMDMAKGAMAKKNMPRVDKRAAGRFVSQALWNPDEKKRRSDEIKRPNKKIKFDENGEPSSTWNYIYSYFFYHAVIYYVHSKLSYKFIIYCIFLFCRVLKSWLKFTL